MRDSELNLPTYNIFRSDRNPIFKSRGGGVLIAISKEFCSEHIKISDPSSIEIDQLFIKISLSNTDFILGAFYVPPSSDLSCYEDISSLQECKLGFPNSNYIILGDYNLPYSNWIIKDNICSYYPRNTYPIIY